MPPTQIAERKGLDPDNPAKITENVSKSGSPEIWRGIPAKIIESGPKGSTGAHRPHGALWGPVGGWWHLATAVFYS